MARTLAEISRDIQEAKLAWSVRTDLPLDAEVPQPSLGGDPAGLRLAAETAALDFAAVLMPSLNPLLVQRRIALGMRQAIDLSTLTPNSPIADLKAQAPPTPPVAGATHANAVDWRNRFGMNWITAIKDQGGCESCWAFAATALVEAMVHIEHAVWSVRSEGDVHDGMGAKCANTGNSQSALDWIKQHGISDPDCYPYRQDDPPYNPCADRAGRTVKLDDWSWIGSTDDQKTWIDTVGPIATFFEVFDDFYAFGNGIYSKGPNAQDRGGHFMLIVGYDETNQCWIVKNSWGTAYGDNGYYRIAYGQCDIDTYSKLGIQGPTTNPDPWTKRRLHSGNLYESGDGAIHRNFEMLATVNGNQVQHWWRDNGTNGFPWSKASVFANDAAVCPTLTGTTYNRNFETVYLSTTSQLHHWWLDQNTGTWNDGGLFGPNNASGVPGFIQGNYGAPGNFEVVVRTDDGTLNHWWRDNAGGNVWNDGGHFAGNAALSGASLVQSNYGTPGNFELVCVLNTGEMQHWWRDNDHGMVWNQGPTFGAGVGSPPCMIQGQYGMGTETGIGNFELCVAVGGQVQHWWRNNGADMSWNMSATFGHDVQAVAGLIEGSFGFNLEVVVLRTDQQLQHYWRDGGGWNEGPIIGSAA